MALSLAPGPKNDLVPLAKAPSMVLYFLLAFLKTERLLRDFWALSWLEVNDVCFDEKIKDFVYPLERRKIRSKKERRKNTNSQLFNKILNVTSLLSSHCWNILWVLILCISSQKNSWSVQLDLRLSGDTQKAKRAAGQVILLFIECVNTTRKCIYTSASSRGREEPMVNRGNFQQ